MIRRRLRYVPDVFDLLRREYRNEHVSERRSLTPLGLIEKSLRLADFFVNLALKPG